MESESRKCRTAASGRAARTRQQESPGTREGGDTRSKTGKVMVLALALALGPVVSTTSALASSTDGAAEVRFELYRGYTIVAKGSIGELQKLNFIIDTGAVPSVVDARIARKLGLEGAADSVSVFSGKDVQVEQVVVPSIRVGPVEADSVRALVHDLRFIEKALGVRIDAIIGLDVLGAHDFTIDYAARLMAFGMPAREAGTPKTDESKVTFENEPGFVVVQVQIQGHPLRLMVDTGTNDLVLFAPRVQGRLAGAHAVGVKTKTSLGGEERLPVLELDGAKMGSTELARQRAVLIDGEGPAAADLDGLLGVASLGVKRIAFDFEHNTIRWEPR